MKLTSPVFENNGYLPERFTCEGDSVNPALDIAEIPADGKSLVLIVDDVDAANGSFIHWVVFDIPAAAPAFRIEEDSIPGKQGTSSAKRKNYAGPCPPAGTHRYVFTAYALDTPSLGLPEGTPTAKIVQAMEGHILAEAGITGRYKKKVQEPSVV